MWLSVKVSEVFAQCSLISCWGVESLEFVFSIWGIQRSRLYTLKNLLVHQFSMKDREEWVTFNALDTRGR